jgi:hypothetical protein
MTEKRGISGQFHSSNSNSIVLSDFISTPTRQYFGNMSLHTLDVQSLRELMQSLQFVIVWFMQSERKFHTAKIILHIEYPGKCAAHLKCTSHAIIVLPNINGVSISFELESLIQISTTDIVMLNLLFYFKLTIKLRWTVHKI